MAFGALGAGIQLGNGSGDMVPGFSCFQILFVAAGVGSSVALVMGKAVAPPAVDWVSSDPLPAERDSHHDAQTERFP